MRRRGGPVCEAASWLEWGPEECGFCLGPYHVELACYCAECDQPVCPLCVVVIRGECRVLCPECATAGGDA